MIGSVAGIATSGNITGWYATLNKPNFNPPNWLFGPVWSILYILMGVSLYIVWNSTISEIRKRALIAFGVQLCLNFAWSFIFFQFKMIGFAFFEILFVLGGVLWMIITFYPINKTAALLQIPYLLWVSFATVLTAAVWKLN
jgi:tryptophan-rich sensory protein